MDLIEYTKEFGLLENTGKFIGKHRTAVAGIGGAVVGAGLNRLRVKSKLKDQGVEKGSEEYKKRMRKATIGGAAVGAGAGLVADFGHRTYKGVKETGSNLKTASRWALTGMGLRKSGRKSKRLRQFMTDLHNGWFH